MQMMLVELATRSLQRVMRLSASLAVLILMGSVVTGEPAKAAPIFKPDATESCVREAYESSPGLSGHAILDCVGRAAAACMTTPGGDTTIGMMECLESELKFWDARLNQAYKKRIAAAEAQDAELRGLRSAAASIGKNLRAMQRAWILFRDASCLYEQAQWMGGTGGGPATLACHMHETARQALKLEGWWAQ